MDASGIKLLLKSLYNNPGLFELKKQPPELFCKKKFLETSQNS